MTASKHGAEVCLKRKPTEVQRSSDSYKGSELFAARSDDQSDGSSGSQIPNSVLAGIGLRVHERRTSRHPCAFVGGALSVAVSWPTMQRARSLLPTHRDVPSNVKRSWHQHCIAHCTKIDDHDRRSHRLHNRAAGTGGYLAIRALQESLRSLWYCQREFNEVLNGPRATPWPQDARNGRGRRHS